MRNSPPTPLPEPYNFLIPCRNSNNHEKFVTKNASYSRERSGAQGNHHQTPGGPLTTSEPQLSGNRGTKTSTKARIRGTIIAGKTKVISRHAQDANLVIAALLPTTAPGHDQKRNKNSPSSAENTKICGKIRSEQ
jgi:hypothetical protein